MFLLDTDHIAIIQWQTQPEFGRLSQRIAQYPRTAFYFSVVSLHEQVLGANAYIQRAKNSAGEIRGYQMLEQINRDFAAAQLLPYDAAASQTFDALRSLGVRIGTLDLRIAAIALVWDFTVLTRNVSDFQKVPGLKVEDWTA